MPYTLGLDLGTTSSAAAVNQGGQIEMLSVDHSAVIVPSVVHLDRDGTFVIGTAAERKAITDPAGLAREFKRRMGDPQPLILNGTPVAANDLMLLVAEELVAMATSRRGETPEALVVCHPANWGSYKVSLLADTLDNSPLPPHHLVTEPEAAAIHYASQERVETGTTLAVYDLGGGTFDAAILRKVDEGNGAGWEMMGEPRGVERLGGIDFDTAILHHVLDALKLDLTTFDDDDRASQAAMVRLRDECRDAKHALSADVATSIPVLLPGVSETVRITRREFESLIDPAVGRTLETLDVALTTANLSVDQLDRILLVGGSTIVPLIGERLAAHTGRPVMKDAHPKHAISLGAAAFASTTTAPPPPGSAAAPAAATPPEPPAPVTPPAGVPKAAAPSPAELYKLPHIDDEPLPDFMNKRGERARRPPDPTPAATAAAAAAAPPTPPAASPSTPESSPPSPSTPEPSPPSPSAPEPSTAAPSPSAAPKPPTASPALDAPTEATPAVMSGATAHPPNEPVGPVLAYEPSGGGGRGRGVLVFMIAFVAVAAVVGGILLLATGDEEGAADNSGTTTTTDADAATTADGNSSDTTTTNGSVVPESSCDPTQFPDPAITYRVSDVPDNDEEQGLNGRNVPSVRAVDGVDSVPITVFPEFGELDLTYVHCEVDDRGRPWWGVNFNDGVTGDQVVWASTLFIEPVPG